MEEQKDIIYEDMKNLRTKSGGDELVVKFKKSFLGGLKENEVNEYIDSLTAQFKRTGQAYKERIDEFTTFTEMLTKERDDAIIQLQKKSLELKESNDEILALKLQIETIRDNDSMEKEKQTENELRESVRAQKEDALLNLSKDNYFLKTQLEQIIISRDDLAGENAVIKKKLDDYTDSLLNSESTNNELKEKISRINSAIRQNEMDKSLKISEFSEKQVYSMKQTAKTLNDIISSIEVMKNDVTGLFDDIKDKNLMNLIQDMTKED